MRDVRLANTTGVVYMLLRGEKSYFVVQFLMPDAYKCLYHCYIYSRGAGRVSGQGGQNSARSAEKNFSFAHPDFQFAHPAICNGCPPCPPHRGGFKGKGLVGH